MWSRKILHRNGSGTITLNRKMMEDAGWSGVLSVGVEIGADGVVTMRPASPGVLVTISGSRVIHGKKRHGQSRPNAQKSKRLCMRWMPRTDRATRMAMIQNPSKHA